MSHHTLRPVYRFAWRYVLRQLTEELPVLQDGSASIGGFENIVDYLRKRSDGDWDIDRQFSNPKDRADVTA